MCVGSFNYFLNFGESQEKCLIDLDCDAPNSAPSVRRGCNFFFLFTINL